MAEATVVIHHEGGTWWAESDQVPGFTVVADTLADLRSRVREGLDVVGWHGEVREVREADQARPSPGMRSA